MELILTKRGMIFWEDECKNLDLRNHRLRLRKKYSLKPALLSAPIFNRKQDKSI